MAFFCKHDDSKLIKRIVDLETEISALKTQVKNLEIDLDKAKYKKIIVKQAVETTAEPENKRELYQGQFLPEEL